MSQVNRPGAIPANIVEALLPDSTDQPLGELAYATFIDDGELVPVSPVDQLLMAFARRILTDERLGQAGVVQLPRAKHRSALLLAIASHLLCRQPPVRFGGPVVLIGFDVDLATQLRSLGVQNHRRMGLASGNPLSAHRLTRLGELQPIIGSELRSANASLVYFNTRVGSPAFEYNPPLVVLDATSVLSPAARTRALEWALDKGAAAVVAIGDIGDDGLVETMSAAGIVPTVLAVNAYVAAELVFTFGSGPASSNTLSSASVLRQGSKEVELHKVPGNEVNEAITRAFGCMAAKPPGPTPPELDLPLNLLRNGTRLAARTSDYRTACVDNPRPGEMPLIRLLDRREFHLPANWRHWQTSQLGGLKVGVRSLWRAIDEGNPKLLELWRVLDGLERTTIGEIAVRCHSRAAAQATRASLSTGERTEAQEELWDRIADRVRVTSFKERFAAGTLDAQVLTGAPPPWLFSLLLGNEAATTHVLCYEAEEALLRRQGQRWADVANGWQRAACRTLGLADPGPVASPIGPVIETAATSGAATLSVPGLGLAEVLDLAATILDPPEVETVSTSAGGGGGSTRTCVPVHLEDGRTWWCIDEGNGSTPVVTVTGAAGHEYRPVKELRSGDRIVVPAGEGTESIHARLVTASRGNEDVKSLDLILSQFRMAARSLLASGTRSDAVDRVRSAGALAADQLPHWAIGTTIAPREPGDVEAVFRAAGKPCPDLGLIYAVATRLRSLNRMLGRFIVAIGAGRGEDAVDRLREVVGPIADELLDEFVVEVVAEIGEPRTVSGSVAGRIR